MLSFINNKKRGRYFEKRYLSLLNFAGWLVFCPSRRVFLALRGQLNRKASLSILIAMKVELVTKIGRINWLLI